MKVSLDQARRLLLDAQGLHDDPARPATPKAVRAAIQRLGFVQLDSIQRIERAHHLILGARFEAYRPQTLHRLAFEDRALFEHWTHDASLIPIVEEAGGTFTSVTGIPGPWEGNGIATNGLLHDMVLELLAAR